MTSLEVRCWTAARLLFRSKVQLPSVFRCSVPYFGQFGNGGRVGCCRAPGAEGGRGVCSCGVVGQDVATQMADGGIFGYAIGTVIVLPGRRVVYYADHQVVTGSCAANYRLDRNMDAVIKISSGRTRMLWRCRWWQTACRCSSPRRLRCHSRSGARIPSPVFTS